MGKRRQVNAKVEGRKMFADGKMKYGEPKSAKREPYEEWAHYCYVSEAQGKEGASLFEEKKGASCTLSFESRT